jgi:hypothetical protein
LDFVAGAAPFVFSVPASPLVSWARANSPGQNMKAAAADKARTLALDERLKGVRRAQSFNVPSARNSIDAP